MGLLNRFFERQPPTQDEFAAMMLKRIRASGDLRAISYEPEAFRFVRSDSRISFLGNLYQEFLRAAKDEREPIIRNFLAMWHTTEMPIPDEFSDVKADILPALRARSFFEIDVHIAGNGDGPTPPYETIGEHLGVALVYDLPTSMMTVNEDALEKWGVTFYEAMEVARQNLQDKPIQYAQVGSAYALANGDAYDATRMMSLDFIRQLTIPGDVIAMVPNRERLYIVGSDDDDGLSFVIHFAEQDVQHERYIAGIAFRLEGDDWVPWLPPQMHSLYGRFNRLRIQTMGQMYASQASLLNMRHEKAGVDVHVATFSAAEENDTGRLFSHCTWAQGLDSMLPKTDDVYLVRPESDTVNILARADWATVQRHAEHLMEPQGMYPERWRVRNFPNELVLARIGTRQV